MAEATSLLIDVTGGFMVDLPSDRDFENPERGEWLKKYLRGSLKR
jgi:4-hydroxybutyryl-CoA dehydratase/vinylacetyl-CoA-Delta-isomerase